MTPEEINQVKELITSALSEAMSKMLSKTTENAKTEVLDSRSRLAVQLRRNELANRIAEGGTNAQDVAVMEKQLRELPRTIPWDADLQEIIDDFDFFHAREKARMCGFKYYNPILGHEDFPTREILIQDALDMADELKDCKCGRLQRGRLVLSKFWDEEHGEAWYTLGYFIEYQENY